MCAGVVTGHDSSGKSVFVSDATVEPERPVLMPDWHTYFPPVGGFRFGLFTIPPEIGASEQELFSVEEAVADIEGKLPGLLRYMDPSDPGMHTSDTIDFEVVLEGTVVLELDDGAEVTLHAGDTVVQNGTRHRWKNPGETPARLALFICGANHSAVPPA